MADQTPRLCPKCSQALPNGESACSRCQQPSLAKRIGAFLTGISGLIWVVFVFWLVFFGLRTLNRSSEDFASHKDQVKIIETNVHHNRDPNSSRSVIIIGRIRNDSR
ncbi:MAG: hypothetical protein L0Y72_16235 [Gemmataceae bacterium]|nr:hypothetical protein [Gemmataceae bacterium]MCI0740597.1 hypothetical protein [Gemmataceae bacterium]